VRDWIGLFVKLLATSLIVVMAWLCAIFTVQIGGIHPTSLSDAEFIRAHNWFCLVSPDSISPQGDLIEWFKAETHARTTFVLVAWAISIGVVIFQHFRGRPVRPR
jgi:hypothetical protein